MKLLTGLLISKILLFSYSASAELTFSSQAQGFGVYTGLSLPMGDFGESYSIVELEQTEVGFANPGISAGLKYVYSFKSGFWGWIFDGSVVMNSFDKSGFENTFREQNSSNLIDAFTLEIDNDWWLNVPFLTGPMLQIDFNSILGIYFTAMAGYSILRAPEITVSGYYYNGAHIGNVRYDYKITATPAYAFETGFNINVITLGARISFLGSKEVAATREADLFGGFTTTESFKREVPVIALQILMGYLF